MSIRSIVVGVLVFLIAAPSAIARQPQEGAEVWRAFAGKLDAGSFVRVRLKDHSEIKGHFVQSTADTFRLQPKTRIPGPIRDVRFSDIESIKRQGEGWGLAKKILVTAGIAGGIAILAVIRAVGQG